VQAYPEDDGMVEIVEEDIEVRTQVVLLFWGGLWDVLVILRVERRRDPSEHFAYGEACKENEGGWNLVMRFVWAHSLELVVSEHR
jgi:hypothetical protein